MTINFKRGDVIHVQMYVSGMDNQIGCVDGPKVWASYSSDATDVDKKESIWGLVAVPFTSIKEHHPREIRVGDYVKYKNCSPEAFKMKVLGMHKNAVWVIADGEPFTTYARSIERV